MMLREKKKSEQVVSCLSGTFPPAHLSSAQRPSSVKSTLGFKHRQHRQLPGVRKVGTALRLRSRKPDPLLRAQSRCSGAAGCSCGAAVTGASDPAAPPGGEQQARRSREAAVRPRRATHFA